MGFSGKHQVVDMGLDSETKKWVIAGIPVRTPLKPIYTTKNPRPVGSSTERDHGDGEECSSTTTTPTGEEARIPTRLTCPPAPKKKKSKPSLKCNYGAVREFFTPPDLESVFIRHHVEKAN